MLSDKVGHKFFSFHCFNEDESGCRLPETCGTTGCMGGECPIIWPEHWEFSSGGLVQLIGYNDPDNSLEEWFELTQEESAHLFLPFHQSPDDFGGERLYGSSTKEEVLSNLKIFIERNSSS